MSKQPAKRTKVLVLRRESLSRIQGGDQHRTTLRCHQISIDFNLVSWCIQCPYTDDEYTCVDCD